MTEAPQRQITFQVISDDPQYAGATYTVDELDDGNLLVYLEYADGSVLDAGLIYADELEGLSDTERLEQVDQRLRDSLLPPRGERQS